MTPLFLLKLLSDLLQGDKISTDKLICARMIIENLVKMYEPMTSSNNYDKEISPQMAKEEIILDSDAFMAKKDLMN